MLIPMKFKNFDDQDAQISSEQWKLVINRRRRDSEIFYFFFLLLICNSLMISVNEVNKMFFGVQSAKNPA